VLKSPIPSILVETAFISNPDEETRLNDAATRKKLRTRFFAASRVTLRKIPLYPGDPRVDSLIPGGPRSGFCLVLPMP